MQPTDLDAVLAMEQACQPTPWRAANFRDCLAGDLYTCHVATLDNSPVAFLVLCWVLDEIHVMNLAVEPAWQRRGVARALMVQAITWANAKTMTVIHLEVRASNQPAQALYQQLGFQYTGRRPDYYQSDQGREDALLMALHL